jgi:polar amino acid transport system permease protein
VVTVVELGTLSWLISLPLLVLLVFVFNSPQIFPPAGPFLAVPFFSGLIGPSGSGKTSLIRSINALEPMASGEVVLFGESYLSAGDKPDSARVRAGVRCIGMVFQNFNLFPHLSVLDNLLMAPRYHGTVDANGRRDTALGLLDKVGLLAHAHKYPHQLSGGQQQRVAIARALALQPDIMLFDEPTSALDPELVGDVLKVIQDLAREGMTMLIVTHEMEFALAISDRVVFMEGGHLKLDVPPEVLRSQPYPNEILQRVRKFMGIAMAGTTADTRAANPGATPSRQ